MNIKQVLATFVGFFLFLSGCATPESSPVPSPLPSDRAVEKRIVSLSPTATETLYQIGAGDQVVAVDRNSNVPLRAPRKEFSGFTPDPQAVLAQRPDIVFAAHESPELHSALAQANIELVMLTPAKSFDEAYAQITAIGSKTGHTDEASELVDSMREQISKEIEKVPHSIRNSGLRYYHESNSNLYSAQDHTFIGQAYSLFGMKSIAGPGDQFPQLHNGEIIDANPALIFLSDYGRAGGTEPVVVAARPGWDKIDAVQQNRIIPLDPDLANRWGPRLPELVASIAQALKNIDATPTPA